ncbi:MAG: alpha/beta hydrolase [Woeseiaceae bacterium]|nr:alpha/beta hydrolase [Woeseiaceae bacterium]
MPQSESLILKAPDAHEIHVCVFAPAGEPRAVIQLFHGLGEYAARYARFAAAATARGFAVVAHDHRGHGGHDPVARGYFAAHDGFDKLVGDGLVAHEFIAGRFPGRPVVLLGHSMGSYVAQAFAMHHGDRLGALVLSASTFPSRLQVSLGRLLARFECWRLGAHRHSALLDKLGFGDFNRRFAPARTELDWLSRDAAEVDAYIADPLCGGPYTAGLWRDLTGGLLRIASDHEISRIPLELPILISGGSDDPVGGEHGMGTLALHYAQTCHSRMTVRIYPGGRHEMLNETNRDEVTNDWLDWMERVV